MSIPVPIPVGATPVTDPETARAEAFVAAITRIIKSGTTGGSAAIGTPAMLFPSGLLNPPIDPLTGQPKLEPVVIDTPQTQLWYRQMGVVLQALVPVWATVIGPSLGNLVFNEVPIGAVNGVNKVFTTANSFIAKSTSFYYNGQRLLWGVDYVEVPANGITITAIFPAPKVGDNLVIDYVKP